MSHKIDTVSARSKLKPRREPYWHRLASGLYVGVRKMTNESSGQWIGRSRAKTGSQIFEALGPLDEVPPHERFDNAAERVRAWATTIHNLSGSRRTLTVADACKQYVAHVLRERGDAPSRDIEARYKRWVAPDPIASVDLDKLTREQFRSFRGRMLDAPVRHQKSRPETSRSKASVNRDMTALRAALNFAFRENQVSTDIAWREALKPFVNAAQPRRLYLERGQRQALIDGAPPDLAMLLRAMCTLPLRPGALAALRVADFDQKILVLRIGKDKHGQNRVIKLSERAAMLFSAAAKGKEADEPLFTRSNGHAWNKDAWKHPVKAAALEAGLPPETSIYHLRHALLTDLAHTGLDLLTIAQLSGTSVSMIEAHYGHMRSEVAMAAIERVAI